MAWPRCSKHKHGEYLGAGVNVIHDCTVTGRRGRCEYQVGKVYHNSSLSQQQRRAGVEQQLLYARRVARMDGSIFQTRTVSPINSPLSTVVE